MHRLIWILIFAFLIGSAGCDVKASPTPQIISLAPTSPSPESMEPMLVADLAHLISISDVIVLGTVRTIKEERINKYALGIISARTQPEAIFRYEVEALEPVKGEYNKGDVFVLDMNGRLKEAPESYSYPEADKDYLFFISRSAFFEEIGFFENRLVSAAEGFMELSGDLLLPQEGNQILKEPISLRDFLAQMQAV